MKRGGVSPHPSVCARATAIPLTARIARRLEPRAVRRILLVTDSEHLTRAVPLFQRVGLEVLPAPADSISAATNSPEERLQLLRRLSQELMARLYYRLAGYL